MAGAITRDQWAAVRDSVREAGRRFAELTATAPDPRAKATRDWSVVDTAVHVGSIVRLYVSMTKPGEAPPPVPGLDEQVAATTVDTVADLNRLMLSHLTDREPEPVLTRLRADIDLLLRATEDMPPGTPMPWLGGARVPLAGILAHLVNELLVHGWDIARATRVPWVIPPEDAGRFFDLFVMEVTRGDHGRLLYSDAAPRDRRIAVEFRSAYTTPVTVVLHNGRVWAEEPGPGSDVRLTFDPPTLDLMLFGRVSRARAALSRKVVVEGRRPWLLRPFLRVVRLPSN